MGIDPVKLGTHILKQQLGADSMGDSNFVNIDEKEARSVFENALKKIEQVRNISSPILKVITLSRLMDELMGLMSAVGEI